MSNHCIDCGAPIPEEQNCCSMCYGDPWHGSDGYYHERLKEREQLEREDEEMMKETRERCLSKHPDEKVRCDLVKGHTGPHQWGGTNIWFEWEQEKND